MIRGWVRVWRKALDNDIIKDQTAWQLFTWLLLKVDRKNGKKKTGRFWVSDELGIKPTTYYKALKRLEKKYKVVTLQVTGKSTEITLTNWHKYQGSNTSSNTSVTHEGHISNTLQEVKNKRIKTITNVIKEYGNPLINEVSVYFLQVFQIPKEDCTQKQSRQYWNLLIKEMGLEKVKQLIDLAKEDEFLAPNITSSKDLYYKRIKVISRKRGIGKPIIAVMPQGGVKNE